MTVPLIKVEGVQRKASGCGGLVVRWRGRSCLQCAHTLGVTLVVGFRRLLGAVTRETPSDVARPVVGTDTGPTMSARVIPSSSLK